MLSGHASHQVGLDADIWLTPMPDRTLSKKEREDMSAVLVVKDRKTMDPKVWTESRMPADQARREL
jgi:penicillin-insensitive murein endopeptidase